MFKKFIDMLKNLFPSESLQARLERYIVSHNPQTVGDIDRLEREFLYRYY
jgi:hypothetical protein